jgi:hypothetical protein
VSGSIALAAIGSCALELEGLAVADLAVAVVPRAAPNRLCMRAV